MSKLFTTIFILFLACIIGNAQTTVKLFIHHKLGAEDFAFESEAKNNLDHDFYLTRMEYYISEIVIRHDGGSKIPIQDTWILVNASETTVVELGSYDVQTLEKITFSIGVDEDHNHLDPASYSLGHPLAPQFPSMHWGWAPGYRFVAMEGKSGPVLNQAFELHALGDENYFKTNVDMNVEAQDGTLEIHLDADYTRSLENIEVNAGLLLHGEYGEAVTNLQNFRDYVFAPSTLSTSTKDLTVNKNFKAYPNPSIDGNVRVDLSGLEQAYDQMVLLNMLGQTVGSWNWNQGELIKEIFVDHSGVYILQLLNKGLPLHAKKIEVR